MEDWCCAKYEVKTDVIPTILLFVHSPLHRSHTADNLVRRSAMLSAHGTRALSDVSFKIGTGRCVSSI